MTLSTKKLLIWQCLRLEPDVVLDQQMILMTSSTKQAQEQSDQGPHCLPVCKNRFEKFARIFNR